MGTPSGQLRVDRRPVLYFALGDGERRLNDRLSSLGVAEGPADLHLLTTTDPGATACAQSVPAFERSDYGKCCCTRFRTTISMQYPWVREYLPGVTCQGWGYRADRRVWRASPR